MDGENTQQVSNSYYESLGLNNLDERQVEGEVVSRIVSELGAYYQLPEEVIQTTSKIPVFIAAPERVKQFVNQAIQQEIEELYDLNNPLFAKQHEDLEKAGINPAHAKQMAINKAKNYWKKEINFIGGLIVRDNKRVKGVYLQAKPTGKSFDDYVASIKMEMEHEFMHILSSRTDGSYGFCHFPRDEQLDEAALQTLVLARNYPALTPEQMFLKIKSGELQTPYALLVRRFLFLFLLTITNEKPVGFKDLARYYFQTGEEASLNKQLFLMEVAGKVPKKLQNISTAVINAFNKDTDEEDIFLFSSESVLETSD